MAFGVFLLLPKELEHEVVDYSVRVARSATNPIMHLGDAAPPHLSVAHVRCAESVALEWWRGLQTDLPRRVTVKLTGIIFAAIPAGDPYAPDGGVYVGLQAVRTGDLDRVHRAAVTAARAAGVELSGAFGDDYQPHVTLGLLAGPPAAMPELPPVSVLRPFAGEFAFGELGAYGTFPRIISPARSR